MQECKIARWPVSRVLSPQAGDGHSSRTPVARRLKQPTRTAGRKRALPANRRAVPIWSCSRWGLPCRFRCRSRGALLPHRFTLTRTKPGGLFSVALSLGSPPPGVTRHRVSVEPGLSSPTRRRRRPSGHLAAGTWAQSPQASRNWLRSPTSLLCVSASAVPSTCDGRQWRWKAVTTAVVSGPYVPSTARA